MRPLSPATSAKLFATGCTVGPIVDSLHNQCLLKYDVLPISLAWPAESLAQYSVYPYYFCSSWTVPPLLGIAYVVLGGVLPRLLEGLLQSMGVTTATTTTTATATDPPPAAASSLRQKAWVAVISTAMIIKLSEYLETNPDATNCLVDSSLLSSFWVRGPADAHLLIMLGAALSQWALLDGTITALLAATITCIGGPLSELPFVAHGIWDYLPSAGDYLPLAQVPSWFGSIMVRPLLGDNYQNLALSSITGPCYFAVTMDAIALGRWFDATTTTIEQQQQE